MGKAESGYTLGFRSVYSAPIIANSAWRGKGRLSRAYGARRGRSGVPALLGLGSAGRSGPACPPYWAADRAGVARIGSGRQWSPVGSNSVGAAGRAHRPAPTSFAGPMQKKT